MRKLIFAVCAALALVSCGGGGDSDQLASSASLAALDSTAAQALRAKLPVPDPTLAAQAVAVANTTIAGEQVLRGIGSLTDGGYAVAWVSDNATLHMQRYDSSGNRAGSETAIPLSVLGNPSCPTNCDAAATVGALTGGSIAVLSDGSVVVGYRVARDLPPFDTGPLITKTAIYIQRFDANGVQVLPETEVVARVEQIGSRTPILSSPKIVALADGGFVVGWQVSSFSAQFGSVSGLFHQRYDGQGQPVGGIVTVGFFPDLSYGLAADASGGYTLTVSYLDASWTRLVSVIHYDAGDTATQIVAPRTGGALVLPLEGDRFVLFAGDATGPFLQLLDSAGNPVGGPTLLSSMPFDARELMDGSFIVFWNSNGSITAQRFDGTGVAIGHRLTLQTSATPGIAALADGGFALAWSAPGTAGDLDVFTQRFVEVLDHNQAALRVQRKACLASAKGMVGQERKAFMAACMG